MILRWGRLLGDTPALQQHGPGLLFALPRPIDEVVRVKTRLIQETVIVALAPFSSGDPDDVVYNPRSLDPAQEGYALTGDHNIVQLTMVARYRVSDPVAAQFYGPDPVRVLRAEALAAMVRSIGEMGVDRLLSDGRKELIAVATRRAQAGLDAAHAGLELTSLELTQLGPPLLLAQAFASVQSAFIGAETAKKNALAFAEAAVPQASAQVDAALQAARARATADLARARGEALAFLVLEREHRANPAVVREQLYRNGIERALSATRVRWIPPPTGGRYDGLRITIGPSTGAAGAGAPAPTVGLPGAPEAR
jgi:membrane protease subunit HflK